MHQYRFTLTQFTPGEAARIAGPSTVMQRDWRRHGFIGSQVGHSRFDVFGLSRLMFLRMVSDRQWSLTAAGKISDLAASGIAQFALRHSSVYEGDTHPLPAEHRARSVTMQKNPFGKIRNLGFLRYLVLWANDEELFTDDIATAFDAATRPQADGAVFVVDFERAGQVLVERAQRPLVHVEEIFVENYK